MSLYETDVRKIAHLARLAIDESNIHQYAEDLNNILMLVEQMNTIDTSAIIPMAHPLNANQRLRVDEITGADQREVFQAIAPKTKSGIYLVPQVIK